MNRDPNIYTTDERGRRLLFESRVVPNGLFGDWFGALDHDAQVDLTRAMLYNGSAVERLQATLAILIALVYVVARMLRRVARRLTGRAR